MRKLLFWSFILLSIMILSVGCSSESGKIPQAGVNEIYSLDQDTSRYIQIKNVTDESDYCRITIDIVYNPEIITGLEDAYDQAEIFTKAIAQDAVAILKSHDADKDISVWAQLPLGEGEVALLGNTWYYADSQEYTQFKRYKP